MTLNIKSLIQDLLVMEKSIVGWETERKKLLEFKREEDFAELRRLIEFREQLRHDLDTLMLAVNNSSATLERYERKAAKDRITLAEAMKKKPGGAGLGDKDPVLITQRNALERALLKLDYFTTELDKVRAALDQKYTAQVVSNLVNLNKALRADQSAWNDNRIAVELRKRLAATLEMHHLS